ncbi:MAG: peptidase S10 [Gammaproteobacteria bacterium]|nr:peptidase S10 [Gammaproteobacteria bacterium]
MKSVTHGSVTVDGRSIGYKAIAGVMVIKNDQGEPYTSMSYVAYVKEGVDDQDNRPITFFYNGGPGSSTVWLHMLAWGPKLVKVGNATLTPPAPWKLVNNDNSLLDATDMVFIDMPGTGFGRIIGKDEGGVGKPDMVWGLDPDAQAFTRFIVNYITVHDRWNSPKFLFGESYGTTRSAVLARDLQQQSVALNGIVLLSAILNFDLSVDGPQGNPGVNISYATGLPSYAATAWFHNKLPGERPADLPAFLDKVEQFAMTDYLLAINKIHRLDDAQKKKIAETMHRYTGLPVDYILEADLTVTGGQFAHELLDKEDSVTGRLDSRYVGPAMDPLSERAHYDPMNSAISAPTVALFNAYVRNTLKFGEDMKYRPSVYRMIYGKAGGWDWEHHGRSGTPNVMNDLAATMVQNPNMNVLLTGGYMDLGTPYYAAEFEMYQLPIPAKLRKNIHMEFFPSGHMIYLNPKAHKKLHDATVKFIEANYKKQ